MSAPHYSFHDLAKLDERVEAHVDGLRWPGDYGWSLCEKALEWGEPGEVFTAGILALESGNPQRLNLVSAKACSHRKLKRGLISAAGWTELEPLRPILDSWLRSDIAPRHRVAVRAFRIHRQDPGPALVHRLFDDDQKSASSFRTVAELGASISYRWLCMRVPTGIPLAATPPRKLPPAWGTGLSRPFSVLGIWRRAPVLCRSEH